VSEDDVLVPVSEIAAVELPYDVRVRAFIGRVAALDLAAKRRELLQECRLTSADFQQIGRPQTLPHDSGHVVEMSGESGA